MTNSSKEKDRPSKLRRDRLRAKERKCNASISNSNLLPIERYYDVANNILSDFNKAVKSHRLDDAFILGRRFHTFSMEFLPKHDNYKNRESLRLENKKHMYKVMDDMEKTVELMDLEEFERRQIRRREEEALRVIKEREVLMKKEEEDRAAAEELMNRLFQLDQIPRGPVQQQQQQTDIPIAFDDLPPPIPFNSEIETDPPPPSYDQLPPSYDRAALLRPQSEYGLKTETSYQEESMRSLQGGKKLSTIRNTPPVHMDDKDSSSSTAPAPSCASVNAIGVVLYSMVLLFIWSTNLIHFLPQMNSIIIMLLMFMNLCH